MKPTKYGLKSREGIYGYTMEGVSLFKVDYTNVSNYHNEIPSY
jgi:hypothetical protein